MDCILTVNLGDREMVLSVPRGTNILEALRKGGVKVPAPCGGRGTCGKCQIIVDKPLDSPPNNTEKRLLSEQSLSDGVRLACTRTLQGDLRCRVSMVMDDAQISTDSTTGQAAVDPEIRKAEITVPQPGLHNQHSDEVRLLDETGCDRMAYSVLNKLADTLRAEEGEVTVLERKGRVIDIEPGRRQRPILAVAVDIGTTTIAAYLMDLATGAQLAVTSRLNPQKAYGDDVITRTDYSRQHENGLFLLQRLVVDEINAMIGQMCTSAGADPRDIMQITAVGNTVMMHLFTGISPANIAMAPFVPAFTGPQELPAGQLGFHIHPEASAVTLPCISGYVGADTVAVALATEMLSKKRPCLILDIGTNGEIMLGDDSGLTACSTAAGPAFEGAHIRYGMGGVAGAISKVTMEDGMQTRTIQDKPATGICGSAIVDIMAELLRHDALDAVGLMSPAGPQWLRDRFVEEEQGWALKIMTTDEGAARDVLFCQRDVREVQLAKGAVAAGIATLLQERGIGEDDIEAVYLAGGFGSYIDPAHACRIGLIPPSLLDRLKAIGNGAGAGAKRALLSAQQMQECAMIQRKTRYIELSTRMDFQNLFVENMMFMKD